MAELGAPPSVPAPEPQVGGRELYGGANEGTVHSYSEDEERSFAEYINDVLVGDEDCGHSLPIDLANLSTMYDAISDGLVLCKLINAVVNDPNLHVDRRALNRKKTLHQIQKVENHNIAINSCINIGCRIVNIGAMDLIEGRKHLVMGILWQIIKFGLLDDVSLDSCPELYRLLREGETLEQLLKLPAEQILLRWFNFHLEAAGSARRVSNFSSDVADSECYTILLKQISRGVCTSDPLTEQSRLPRAEKMLAEAAKIDCDKLITAGQVVAGNPRLNLAFVANVFNTMPGLEPLVEEEAAEVKEVQELQDVDPENEADSRNERAFRAWFNSLGVEKEVHDLFDDVKDGVVLLQCEDKLQPGIVDWPQTYPIPHDPLHATTNCNFAVEYGKKLGCQLVNIGGSDITAGNRKLILGLSWQLMRLNIFQTLGQLKVHGKAVDEAGLISWANEKVQGKSSPMTSFQDKNLSDGLFFLHMLDAVRPEAIEWEEVKVPGADRELSDDEKHENASYLINIARKIGCKIFLTWEDVVEVQPKMVTTLLAAALMVEQAPTAEELAAMQEDEELKARAAAAEEARKRQHLKMAMEEAEAAKQAEAAAKAKAAQEAATTAAEQKAANKAAAKTALSGLAKNKKVKGRKPPKGELDLSDPELEEAWQAVSSDVDDTDWVWYTLKPDNSGLRVMEQGDDGLEGMLDELDDCRVMFGYIRCIMDDGRPKFVQITWTGPGGSEAQKSWAARAQSQIDAFMKPNHLHIQARDEDDIDEDEIMEKLKTSGGASY